MRAYPNTYMDLTGDGFELGRLEYFIEQVTSERILYGSDSPWIDPRFVLGEILGAPINDLDRENILGGNARRLFRLPRRRKGLEGQRRDASLRSA
jgi:predicted TIM-barrel fold metal-dependent hydrolase